MGSRAIVTNPNRLVAQPMPSLLYICTVNSGKAAPSTYLNMPLAAVAEAPASDPYVSIKYNTQEQKINMLPIPNGTVARSGAIQWISARAVQANQNRLMGSRNEPN